MPDVSLSQVDEAAQRLLELEAETVARATDPLRKPVASLLARLHALWPGDEASPAAKRAVLLRLNVGIIQTPMGRVIEAILAGADLAQAQGIEGALQSSDAELTTLEKLGIKAKPSAEVRAAADAINRSVPQTLLRAVGLLGRAETLNDAQAAIAVAATSISRVEATASWVVNRAANDGITEVANTSMHLVSVWRTERDACVHCLAYAGEIDTGKGYPSGLTYGAKPLSLDNVPRPPLHPRCRCTQYVLERESAKPVARALKREAQRSVLRGWSLQSESDNVRLSAAQRLLNQGTTLPKSVQAYARSAVKRGEFKRGRDFPS